MKPFLQQQRSLISTLSPVHMGCGEDYYPTQYIIEDGSLYAFDELQMHQALGGKLLLQLAELAASGRDALTAVQKRVYENRENLKPIAGRCLPVASGIEKKYRQTLAGGKNELAIQRTFYNPYDQQPVIPGSGIKGAIRTALLDEINNGRPWTGRGGRGQAEALQKSLLEYKGVTDDPLRLLKVGDGHYAHADGLAATEVLYAVRRRRDPKPDRRPNSTTVMVECISPWRSRCAAIDLGLHDRSLAEPNSRHLPVDLPALAACCNAYYLPKLQAELRFLDEKRYSHAGTGEAVWAQRLRQLLAGELGQALADGRALLLRLGKYGGAEDKTLNGVRSIKIMRPRPENPVDRDRTTEVGLAASHTDEVHGLMPFGWVLVELGEQPLPQTMALLKELAAPAYARRQADAEREAARRRWLDEQAAAQQRAQEAREAAERAEAEKKAALAAMSDEQRALHAIQTRMQGGEGRGGGTGCQLAVDLAALITQAADWSPGLRQELHALAMAVYAHLGVDPKSNKKVKDRLKGLR